MAASTSTTLRPKRGDLTTQIVLRVPAAWIREADELAAFLCKSQPGLAASRSVAWRMAIARGLYELRADMKAKQEG